MSNDSEIIRQRAEKLLGNHAQEGATEPVLINDLIKDIPIEVYPGQPYFPEQVEAETKKIELANNPVGMFEQIGHTAAKINTAGYLNEAMEERLALDINQPEEVPEGWTPKSDRFLYESTSPQYWDSLADTKGPKAQKRAYDLAQQKMAEEERFNNNSGLGGWFSSGIGAIFGMAVDPVSYVPFAASLKYSSYAKTLAAASLEVAPKLGALSVARETAHYIIDPQESLADAGYHAITDAAAGMFLFGGMAGFGRGWEGFKLYQSRRALNMNIDGVGVKFNVAEDGSILGAKATASEGSSVGADKVKQAQEFLDTRMQAGGLFYIPYADKVVGLFSVPVRGLSSKNPLISNYTNVMVDHDIAIAGGNKLVPDQMSFEKRIKFTEAEATTWAVQMEGIRKGYNFGDFSMNESAEVKGLETNLNKQNPLNTDEFGKLVSYQLASGEISGNPKLTEAANLWTAFTDKHWNDYRDAMGYDEDAYPNIFAKNYLTTLHDRSQMRQRPAEWVNNYVAEANHQDTLIFSLERPVQDLNTRISALKSEIRDFEATAYGERTVGQELPMTGRERKTGGHEETLKSHEQLTALKERLAMFREQKKQVIDDLLNEIDANPDLHLILKPGEHITNPNRKKLKKFLKPLHKAYNKLKASRKSLTKLQASTQILHFKLQKLPNKLTNLRKEAEEHNAIAAEIKANEVEIERLKLEVEKLSEDASRLEGQLKQKAQADKNMRPFYKKQIHAETGEVTGITFKDYRKTPKFRARFADDAERALAAHESYDAIMNLSDSELANQRIQTMNGTNGADVTKARSIMMPTTMFLNGNFLRTNLPAMGFNYAVSLGRKTAYARVMKGFNDTSGQLNGNIFGELARQYKDNELKIRLNEKLTPQQKEKQQAELYNQFVKDKEYVTNLTDSMLGRNYNNPLHEKQLRKFTTAMRLLAVSVRLGMVPLTQITDQAAMTLKHGPIRHIRDGLLPAITTFNGYIKGANAKYWRRRASEANLALETVNRSLTNHHYDLDPTSSGNYEDWLNRGLANMAHWASNISGMNPMENFNQRMAASIVDAKIISHLLKFQKGKLSEKGMRELDRAGIDPAKWAERMLKQYKSHGKQGLFGSHQSHFFNWSDAEAKVKFSQALYADVNNTIIRRGRVDMPFMFNNHIIATMTQFMGWSFAAFNRYTVPVLQRGEANHLMGALLMGYLGAFEVITRKWARGEEVDLDEINFPAEALANSGVTSLIFKGAMMANAMMGGGVLDKLKTDKYRNQTLQGMIGGPSLGVLGNAYNVLKMIGNNDYNKHDIESGLRSLPIINNAYTYRLMTKFSDTVTDGLPLRSKSELNE